MVRFGRPVYLWKYIFNIHAWCIHHHLVCFFTFHIATTDIIAFYAYMSHNEVHPGPHHTIIFDVPVTNVGNGYNHFSGIFSVPSSGVYVFSWTIADSPQGFIFSELVVNSDVIGGILTQTLTDNDRISTTGLVVKEVAAGNVVYVRTSSTGGIHGDIQSLSPVQRSSFSGWRQAWQWLTIKSISFIFKQVLFPRIIHSLIDEFCAIPKILSPGLFYCLTIIIFYHKW